MSTKTYQGKRFLLFFAISLLLIMAAGLAFTWLGGSLLTPVFKEKRERQQSEQQAARQRAIEAQKRGEPVEEIETRGRR